jgi:calcium permeable stress-gated cation channel
MQSFRSVTPDPSVTDFFAEEPDPSRPPISRPRPLTGTGTARKRMGRTRNPAHGSSSYAPSSYMLPSSYYKLRRIEGVSSPLASSTGELIPGSEPSLAESIRQRVVGSRFQEVNNRPSTVWGRLPLGTAVRPDEKGVLHPIDAPTEPIPDPSRFGPNHIGREDDELEGEWVDLMRERDENAEHSIYGSAQSGPSERPESTAVQTPGYGQSTPRDPHMSLGAPATSAAAAQPDPQRRPLIWNYPASHRSTFPMRPTRYSELDPSLVPAPHLRLQSRGPFFRPVSGLAHEDLGTTYADIARWRSKLKTINQQISDVQNDGYGDIAEGKDVKGWLIVGRGVRFLPGVQMIEGRAKEDIRWHELQNEGGTWNVVAIIVICILVAVTLAVGRKYFIMLLNHFSLMCSQSLLLLDSR